MSECKQGFLIPDYQRPYAWGEDECQQLWDDFLEFAKPGEWGDFDYDKERYFLGSIVTFKNEEGKFEVIDGQQRLTTILLLLRAFHQRYSQSKDERCEEVCRQLNKCLWKVSEEGKPLKGNPKIMSNVVSKEHSGEFEQIITEGEAGEKWESNYAKNYNFFLQKIDRFVGKYLSDNFYLPIRIMNNVTLLLIEADSQLSALRIFSTLNDRGLPLSDADIFKSQFYKFFNEKGRKDEFVERWKQLEERVSEIFASGRGSPMDELFTRYMYFEWARQGIRTNTTKALRDFFSAGNYKLLKDEVTLQNLEKLANFWKQVADQDPEAFSEEVLKRLFVLNYAPNGMWTYICSVYFLTRCDKEGKLNNEEFLAFLRRITALIFSYALTIPGGNALRTPLYPAMNELADEKSKKDVTFENFKFKEKDLRETFKMTKFSNSRAITRTILTWYAFNFQDQKLLELTDNFQLEHIYARNRHKVQPLKKADMLESLGNKSLLERKINISASDYQFEDKRRKYTDEKSGTKIWELREQVASNKDFKYKDIERREMQIVDAFIEFLKQEDLIETA